MLKIFSDFKTKEDFNFLYDKFKDKPITIFNDYIPQSYSDLQHNPYNFLIIHEPNEFFGMHNWVLNNHQYFTGILTWNQNILNQCENAILFHHSCNHLELDYINSFISKSKIFEISFLSGTKDLVEGHKLRHEIYSLEPKNKNS